jgi:xanthine dehydrogenase small subunit
MSPNTPTMNTRPIRFLHRGAVVDVTDAAPTRTVLEWLREDARCTGTKEGCAEGDCGACTVVLGELDDTGALQLRPVNACIQFLPTLDGKALFTVEDLRQRDGSLHPVQDAMVGCHGSQCGFCTPGFVMSLAAFSEKAEAPTRPQVNDALSGNLCRCRPSACLHRRPNRPSCTRSWRRRAWGPVSRWSSSSWKAGFRSTASPPILASASSLVT